MKEIKTEDKEEFAKLPGRALVNLKFSGWQRQENAKKAALKRMARDKNGYGFTYDELLKLKGRSRMNKIIDIVGEHYAGYSFALLSASEFNDVMHCIFQDIHDISSMCDLLKVTKKFGFQKTRRLHYVKRTKKYWFS